MAHKVNFMKDLISGILLFVSCIFFIISALATPVAIIYGISEWAGNDVAFKAALWSSCKLWVLMVLMAVPGLILHVFSK
jgi:hypothetical protein